MERDPHNRLVTREMTAEIQRMSLQPPKKKRKKAYGYCNMKSLWDSDSDSDSDDSDDGDDFLKSKKKV